ncbi:MULTISPECIES: malto-oligosyltrehalose synthase [unclassified Xanthobacter]|uniref:malto-oligosyltrehalose synthase n=1 Tax=unclassified Xanthobacter TaxID=2623496 RepID=UPI001F279ED4
MTVPRAAVRLQFEPAFPLDAAVGLVDYFADLGASHITANALLAGRADLPGGVVDHDTVEPRIGGEEGLRQLVAALRRRQMGLIVDITPAAMAVGGADNETWNDLLEWGRDSAHAHWFDVDWRGADPVLRNKLLAPFLDQPYGVALDAGSLQLAFDSAQGRFLVRHHAHAFPICPLHYAEILEAAELTGSDELAAPFTRLPRLRPDPQEAEAARRTLMARAATPEGRTLIAAACGAFDSRTEPGRERLHRLLERQSFRLAWWGTAADELNWTRLPDTTALAAIRTERPDVFDATHGTLVRLYAEGLVDGFVIRQWDLLGDPAAYTRRLRLKLESAAASRPAGLPALYLAAGTVGAGDIPPGGGIVAGTAGAEAQEDISAVLHDPAGGTPLGDLWVSATGERQRFDDQRALARRQALAMSFGAQLDRVVDALVEVARCDLKTRDTPRASIARCVRELAVALPIRRTYADVDGFDAADAALFAAALKRARRRFSPLDLPVAEQMAAWLGGEAPRQLGDFEKAGAREEAIAAFQQLTAALGREALDEMLAARFGRLVSRNEPGSDPAWMGLAPDAFHDRMAARASRSPHALSATAGPDQQRGEDARMRLAVLSVAPREWEALLWPLLEITAPFRSRLVDGVAPEPRDVVILVQTLIGAWPHGLRADDALGLGSLHDRVKAWWMENLRRARMRTRPHFPDTAYEQGCAQFLATLMEGEAGAPARRLIAAFLPQLARASAVNALSQVVLKCTVPGIPELFQGTEFWDFGLGAGDGAPAVDHLARADALATGGTPDFLLESFADGRVKQATIARLLHLRATEAALYRDGEYLPLPVQGPRAAHALAFARRHRDAMGVTVVTRLAYGLLGLETALPKVAPGLWQTTRVTSPELSDGAYRDALTGRVVEVRLGRFDLSDALDSFPAAVLLKM